MPLMQSAFLGNMRRPPVSYAAPQPQPQIPQGFGGGMLGTALMNNTPPVSMGPMTPPPMGPAPQTPLAPQIGGAPTNQYAAMMNRFGGAFPGRGMGGMMPGQRNAFGLPMWGGR